MRVRTVVLLVALGAVGALLTVAFLHLPAFGASWHPYRDLSVAATYAHRTANAVSSVNFDQRGYDTFGEETILFCSVLGIAALLRPVHRERRRRPPETGAVLESTKLLVYLLFPATLLVGLSVVSHGAITPGGGFQGGVILATGIHLLYVGGRFRLLERFRPLAWFEGSEAIGVIFFAALGVAGLAAGKAYFANVIPQGSLAQLVSAGTVPLFNVSVGIAVCGSIVVLIASFLDQVFAIHEVAPRPGSRIRQEDAAG